MNPISSVTNTTIPNFIIGGAPKCGTTAMANYLRDHSQVFVSDTKEPFYFATDLPGMRKSTRIDTEQAYIRLFDRAQPDHLAIGEGSTLYLYSESAISEALKFNSEMKFLFMLRRPAEIAYAYHMQMRFHEFEPIEDFETAWRSGLTAPRVAEELTMRCREPKLTRYCRVAAIGSQLLRATQQIPADQLLVILFDDFAQNTEAEYRKALDFLGVRQDCRSEFAKENAAMKSRLPHLTRALRSPPVVGASQFLKRRLGGRLYSSARKLKHNFMFKRAPRPTIGSDFNRELHEYFEDEVEMVEQILGRDLTHWKLPGDN